MMKSSLPIIIVTGFLMAAAGFFGGVKYQQSKTPGRGNFQNRIMSGEGTAGFQPRAGAQAVRGEIISQDDSSITVKLPDESTKIVLISENTSINKATEATAGDLTVGESVMVFGTDNSDGSVSASQIQLNFNFDRDTPPIGV